MPLIDCLVREFIDISYKEFIVTHDKATSTGDLVDMIL